MADLEAGDRWNDELGDGGDDRRVSVERGVLLFEKSAFAVEVERHD
jgi:hypothetical protein